MSRSGYSDSCDGWELIMWRGAVAKAIKGKRGQAFLRELLDALENLPHKRLIRDDLEYQGEVCAIGSVGVCRGVNMKALDPDDRDSLAKTFGIAPALVAEIEFINDDEWSYGAVTEEQRYERVVKWVRECLNIERGHPDEAE